MRITRARGSKFPPICNLSYSLTSITNRIYVPGTEYCVDLSDHGNPNNGTIVTLWAAWKGANQAWIFDQV
jgi:hypothetical protein